MGKKIWALGFLLLAGCTDGDPIAKRAYEEENASLRRKVAELQLLANQPPQIRYLPSPFERECPICPANDWLKWEEVKKAAQRACKNPRTGKMGTVNFHGLKGTIYREEDNE